MIRQDGLERRRALVVSAASVGSAMVAAGLVVVQLPWVLGAAGAALVVLALAFPALVVAALAVASPAALVPDTDLGFAVLAGGCAVAIVAAVARNGVREARPATVWMSVFVMLLPTTWLLGTMSSGETADPARAIQSIVTIALAISFYWATPRDATTRKRILYLFVAAAVAVAAWDLASRMVGGTMPWLSVDAPGIDIRRHNISGIVFLLACAVLLPLTRYRSGFGLMLQLGALALLILATAASVSRSAYVAGIVVVVVWLALTRGRSLVTLVAAGLVTLAVAAVIANDIARIVVERVVTTAPSAGLDLSASVRFDLWESAWRMFLANPVTGVGFLHGAERLPAYWTGSASDMALGMTQSTYLYAHNLPLTVLSQTGVVGFATLAVAVIHVTRDAAHAESPQREQALLALGAVGAASMFGEPILSAAVAIPFWLCVRPAREHDGLT